jgi:DNA invertase Pin-like site-specific DNA recombinase
LCAARGFEAVREYIDVGQSHLLLALEEFRSLGIQFINNENIDTSSPLGPALFTIVSAVAQLERDLIRERVSAGIRNARAKGRRFGRPLRAVDLDRILQMKGEGQSLRQIAENVGVGYGTVRERLKGGERKTLLKRDCEKPPIQDT